MKPLDRIRLTLAIIASHLEALWWRADSLIVPPPRGYNGYNQRVNPRQCPLCHGPMQLDDQRSKRLVKGDGGQFKSLPPEVLVWFRCGRCRKSLIGLLPHEARVPA